MKRFLLIAILFAVFVISSKNMQAQINISVNVGQQPAWGPTGYDYVDYYYMPDIDVYYYVPRHQYVYLAGGRWVFSTSLPARYRNYDLYSGYKVVINEPRPYLRNDVYRERYAPYRGRRDQVVIRNSNEPKYYIIKGHPKYNGHDNGKHNGWYKNGKGRKGRD